MPTGADGKHPPVGDSIDPGLTTADVNLQIFARSLAHDFNNLITGILGHAALIEAIAPPDDPDIAESAAIIRKTAERATELNAQLMNLSKSAAPRAVTVNLHETIREVAGLVAPSLGNRVRIRLELQAERSNITGDPGQLHQMLLNLAINARDAMPVGGILCFATESSGGILCIRVSDTGSGIPIELHQRVFEPMFTTKADGKGSGLGLAVVKRVVEQHSGNIELRSAPGMGTSFWMRFPMREPAPVGADSLRALSVGRGT